MVNQKRHIQLCIWPWNLGIDRFTFRDGCGGFFDTKQKSNIWFKWQICCCCFSYFQHFLLKCERSKHLFIFYFLIVLPGEEFCLLKFNGYSIRTTSIPVTSDSNNGSCYKQLEETLGVYYIHAQRSSLWCQYNGKYVTWIYPEREKPRLPFFHPSIFK